MTAPVMSWCARSANHIPGIKATTQPRVEALFLVDKGSEQTVWCQQPVRLSSCPCPTAA